MGFIGFFIEKFKSPFLSYVEVGLHQGRRGEDLTGGGLIRSLGGWSEVKKHRLKSRTHVMSDERILGDSDFVDSVLSHAGEKYERQYELKRRGYDLNRVVKRVAEIYSMDEHEVFSKGRQREKVIPQL
jgi:putative transposase